MREANGEGIEEADDGTASTHREPGVSMHRFTVNRFNPRWAATAGFIHVRMYVYAMVVAGGMDRGITTSPGLHIYARNGKAMVHNEMKNTSKLCLPELRQKKDLSLIRRVVGKNLIANRGGTMPPAASKKEAEVTGNDGIGRETVLNVSDAVQRPCASERDKNGKAWRNTTQCARTHTGGRKTKADWRRN